MSPQPDRGVMGSLPRTRPHRRSDKRPQAVEPTAAGSDTAAGTTGTAEPTRAAGTTGTAGATRAAGTTGTAGATSAAGTKRPTDAKRAEWAAPKARAAAKPAAQRTTTKPRAAARGASHPAASRPAAAQRAPSRPAADADKSPGALETAVQAVAELTEIGLHAGARALRGTLSRLSR